MQHHLMALFGQQPAGHQAEAGGRSRHENARHAMSLELRHPEKPCPTIWQYRVKCCPSPTVPPAPYQHLSQSGLHPPETDTMPRYFFNTRIGEETIPDHEGEELRDPDQAWEVARTMIVELLNEEGDQPALLAAAIVVTDGNGEIVLEFPFSEALIGRPDPDSVRH
jgi:hypothetical protein